MTDRNGKKNEETAFAPRPGENCWQAPTASRATFLVDGAAYFGTLYETLCRARRSILLLGWDIDSRLQLVRDGREHQAPTRLGELLDWLAAQRPELQIHVLVWDFAMIYALEREWLPVYRLGWRTHRRLHFHMDDCHPIGASHHQKVVVVDDQVAFSGGLDLSKWRWDTSEHAADAPERIDPDGNPYPPFHDLQMMVEGEAAAALGRLARERWAHATGKALPPLSTERPSPWPDGVAPDVEGARIMIARTDPVSRDGAETREVEQLFLETIAAARNILYIENQYLTSHRLAEALERRLAEPAGPEIVMVLPDATGGWLEKHTMDVLRGRLLHRLWGADHHNRLRVYYPRTAGSEAQPVNVHAKVMVIDDWLARIGSANLSNRSMGLDTECDLALLGETPATREAVTGLRNRLLAEHLGTDRETVARTLRAHEQKLIPTIEALRGGERTLLPLDGSVSPEVDALVPESEIIDPERPIPPEQLVNQFMRNNNQKPAIRRLILYIVTVVILLLLGAAWQWTPLNRLVEVEQLSALAGALRDHPLSPLLVPAGYLIGGFLVLPLTALVLATLATFGPLSGFVYALGGAMLSALATYGVGRLLGRNALQRLSGPRLNTLNRHLARQGVLAIFTVRIIPVAPFTVINLVAGATHIRLRDYLLGSLLGMLPGLIALSLFMDQLLDLFRNPGTGTVVTLVVVSAVIVLAVWGLQRWLRQREQPPE